MYGRRRFSKGRSTRRAGAFTRAGPRRTYKKVGRSFATVPRFATVGFARNVEKKYWDKSYQGLASESQVGSNTGDALALGFMYISDKWQDYNFANTTGPVGVISNDFNKGLTTGTTARTRVANKVTPSYYKGSFTFTAASIDAAATQTQNGETWAALAAGSKFNYLRTTYRMVIVKDLQVNSSDAQVKWDQVFETNTNLTAGIHSELSVDNMGRFIVLEDKYFTVDAQSPQKTCPFQISGTKVGTVRYNGPSGAALTDKGIYVIYAAYVMGVGDAVTPAMIRLPSVVGNTRMCFSDD